MSDTKPHRILGAITRQVDGLKAISKAALRFGDQILVRTLNSTYSIQVLTDELYAISGGWFDKEGLSPLQTTINGGHLEPGRNRRAVNQLPSIEPRAPMKKECIGG